LRPNFDAIERDLADPNLDPQKRKEIEELLNAYALALELNPLEGFWPHSLPQQQFLRAWTPIVAAFAGNRFGKTTALVVKCLIQHTPLAMLPSHLRAYKFCPEGPVRGRLLVPTEDSFEEYMRPTLQRWCPKALYEGGSWEKAWSKQHWILRFQDGGALSIYTYGTEPSSMPGTPLHYVGYDEPPPEAHRKECLARLMDYDGREFFALTPVNLKGGGIGWLYRKVWKRREAPDVTVVKASPHDNPMLSKEVVERILAEFPEEERPAREFGDFLHLGGMVYQGGFEACLVPPLVRSQLAGRQVVVGMDPGLKNAAFVWVVFDQDNRAVVFDEVLLQDKTPTAYLVALALKNADWGLLAREERDSALKALEQLLKAEQIPAEEYGEKRARLEAASLVEEGPLYVIDPSSVSRGTAGERSVESILNDLGFYPMHADHSPGSVQAGVQVVRDRKLKGAFFVARDCRGVRSEADEYRMEDRPDGEFKVVKENDHRLDALRYAVMTQGWSFSQTQGKEEEQLGYKPGHAPALNDFLKPRTASSPLGAMS
jgi:hypothetical protein